MASPEECAEIRASVILSHVQDINNRISIADITPYAGELLQAGLIGSPEYESAITVTGMAPAQKLAPLITEATRRIKNTPGKPKLFDALVTIIGRRDKTLASKLRQECDSELRGGNGVSPGPGGTGPTGGGGGADGPSIPVPPAKSRPTYNQLVNSKKPDGSDLKIIKWITASKQSLCFDFATMLLKDDVQVAIFNKESEDKDDFVRNVLKHWLARDDGNPNEPAVPRTWSALAQCVTDADLPGDLAKAIRDTFP